MQDSDPRKGDETIKSVRPWGNIHILVRNRKCSVDLTSVSPGGRSSLHAHTTRYELFHFLDHGATLELDGAIHRPEPHDEFLIAPGVKHRFWAENKPFRMLVVSFGQWNPEDQIRIEDDYGREQTPLKL